MGEIHIVGWAQCTRHLTPNCADLRLNPWFHMKPDEYRCGTSVIPVVPLLKWGLVFMGIRQKDAAFFIGKQCYLHFYRSAWVYLFTYLFVCFAELWGSFSPSLTSLCFRLSLSHVYRWWFQEQVLRSLSEWGRIFITLSFSTHFLRTPTILKSDKFNV